MARQREATKGAVYPVRQARLLRNPHIEGAALTPFPVELAPGEQREGWVPVLMDQDHIQGAPILTAGARGLRGGAAGRSLGEPREREGPQAHRIA
jgi:hypothetical protein